jgi:hypothetical protein
VYCPICDQKPMNCDCTEVERRMHSEIEDLEEQIPRWVSVAERLPPDRTVVLAWNGRRVVFGYARDGNWIDTLYGWAIPNGPSHWMPMPSPPSDCTPTEEK